MQIADSIPDPLTLSMISTFDNTATGSHFHTMDAHHDESVPRQKKQEDRGRSAQILTPFFGVPIVGFFRPRPIKTNLGERASFASPIRNDPADYGTRPNTFVNEVKNAFSPTIPKTRSAKERWARLRRHVEHESFHIQDSLKGCDANVNKDDVHFDNVDLPYEFSLLDCALAFAAYLLISIIAFSFTFEHWSIIDSMYFAVVTFTTIGYGDISPTTMGGKFFCVFFALSGVAVLAIALGVVGSKIIEAEVQSISNAETELVKDMTVMFRRRQSSRLEKQKGFASSHASGSRGSSSFSYLTEYDDPNASFRIRADAMVHPCGALRRRWAMFFEMMRHYLPALAPLFLGSFIIGHFEGWDWEDTIYYCIVTTTTIGYGDLTPQHESTKLFSILFIPLAVGAMGHFLGTVANFIMEQRVRVHHKRLWRHELTIEDLQAMSTNADGSVSELDYVLFMLQAMKKVDSDLICTIRQHFCYLDQSNNGTLERTDLELMAKRKLRTAHTKLQLADYKAKLMRQGSALSTDKNCDAENDPENAA